MLSFVAGSIVVCAIVFLLTWSIILIIWERGKKVEISPSKCLINSIKRKEERDNLEDMIDFLKRNPNIKYHINTKEKL